MNKSINDLNASIEILKNNIQSYYNGIRNSYRVIAGQLRLLLCDGKNGENSLLPRIFQNFKLHIIRRRIPINSDEIFSFPGLTTFDGRGGSKLDLLFDESMNPMSLNKWLGQPLFSLEITIEEFIKSVANKEGVHSDKNYNDTIIFSKSVRFANEEILPIYIVAIGEYLLRQIEIEISKIEDQ